MKKNLLLARFLFKISFYKMSYSKVVETMLTNFQVIESLYKYHIRKLETNVATLEDSNITDHYDIGNYIKRQELKRYISNYRLTLARLKEYGKGYVGHSFEDWWVENLTPIEKSVFKLRYQYKKRFSEIKKMLGITDPPGVYNTAYRKVIAKISEQFIKKEGS